MGLLAPSNVAIIVILGIVHNILWLNGGQPNRSLPPHPSNSVGKSTSGVRGAFQSRVRKIRNPRRPRLVVAWRKQERSNRNTDKSSVRWPVESFARRGDERRQAQVKGAGESHHDIMMAYACLAEISYLARYVMTSKKTQGYG